MNAFTKITLAASLAALSVGCATPLNSAQKRDMQFYQSKGYVVEEKNPAAAAGLGLPLALVPSTYANTASAS